jgi:hypothetical protein
VSPPEPGRMTREPSPQSDAVAAHLKCGLALSCFTRCQRHAALFQRLRPGLITGAADEDPSGIATYSQAGAQDGVNMLWTMVLTYPLMTAIAARCVKTSRFHTGMRSQLTGQM